MANMDSGMVGERVRTNVCTYVRTYDGVTQHGAEIVSPKTGD